MNNFVVKSEVHGKISYYGHAFFMCVPTWSWDSLLLWKNWFLGKGFGVTTYFWFFKEKQNKKN